MRGIGLVQVSTSAVGLREKVRSAQSSNLTVSVAELFGGAMQIPAPRSYTELLKKYGTSAWVYICVRKKARDLGSAPLVAYRESKDESDEPLESTHPLQRLFAQPNPWHPGNWLMQITSAWLDLVGNAFWFIARDRARRPTAILPINPTAVVIYEGEDEPISHYEVWQGGERYDLLPHRKGRPGDIIHFSIPNPMSFGDSPHPNPWGVGPLEAGWTLVVTDEDAVRWNRNLVKNDGRPAGMMKTEQVVTEEQADEAADRFYKQFGGPQGAGRLLVLGRGLEYVRMADTPKDLDYVKSRESLREEILALFGVNAAILGLGQGDVGRRKESHKEYWQSTIVATSESDICPLLTMTLGTEFGEGITIAQDFAGVKALQDDQTEMSALAMRYWQMGVPFAELNRRFELGFDEFESDDVGFLPLSLAPAKDVAEGAALSQGGGGMPGEEPPFGGEEGELGPDGKPVKPKPPFGQKPKDEGEEGGEKPPAEDEEADDDEEDDEDEKRARAVQGLEWMATMARRELRRRALRSSKRRGR